MISVIIPTLNEAARLPGLLDALARESTPHEVIVSDGGSGDGTPAAARRGGARLVTGQCGRGAQLRRAAEGARGDLLLFLHADCRFPPGGLAAIADSLARDPALQGGNFCLLFDGGDSFSAWLTGFYRRIRARGIYYGDSGIFLRRRVYDALGGIRPLAVMEDYEFVRRLERAGPTCCIADPALVTSARRFEGRRPVAIVGGWILIHVLFYLGVPSGFLARLYRSRRHGPEAPSTTKELTI